MATTQTSDGVEIHYETSGEGPDVVLVHGLTDSAATWGPITGMLGAHNRVTTLDLRGMGRSGDAADYSAAAMAADVDAVVRAAGVTDPLVVGHSLGGVVVTAYASAAPVRGVINVDQSLHLSAFQAGLHQVEPLLRDPDSFGAAIEMVFAAMDGTLLDEATKADIAATSRRRQEVVLGVWNQVLTLPIADLDAVVTSMTAGVSAPYLALHFLEAPEGYDGWLRERIPQAVVEQWEPELGHYGHRVDPERFVQRVRDFDATLTG